MAAPIIVPEPQFSDADGMPYAGGTIATYIPATSTPKQTWVDPEQLALNTNPIILDAAGRCIMFGDGDYRLVLRDALGNLIWDQPSTSIVSAAMAPVVAAATIDDAVEMLGIDDLIAVEAAARVAADNTEAATRYTADQTEATDRIAADEALSDAIDAETTRAEAAEAALAGGALSGGSGYAHVAGSNLIQWGSATASGAGTAVVNYPIAFPTAAQSVQATLKDNPINLTIRVNAVSAVSFAVAVEDTDNTTGYPADFSWAAFGH